MKRYQIPNILFRCFYISVRQSNPLRGNIYLLILKKIDYMALFEVVKGFLKEAVKHAELFFVFSTKFSITSFPITVMPSMLSI